MEDPRIATLVRMAERQLVIDETVKKRLGNLDDRLRLMGERLNTLEKSPSDKAMEAKAGRDLARRIVEGS